MNFQQVEEILCNSFCLSEMEFIEVTTKVTREYK